MLTFEQALKKIWKNNNIELVGLGMIILSGMNFLNSRWSLLTFVEFAAVCWGTSYLISKPKEKKRKYVTACNKH